LNFSHVISNAGPLLVLAKLNRLELLVDLYHQVQIPQTVYHEIVTQGLARGATDALTFRLFWQQRQWSILEPPADTLSTYTSR
jgi:predicted nucleic acid-binding protein